VYHDYAIGVPEGGEYQEVLNSDALEFGGSGQITETPIYSNPEHRHHFGQHIKVKIPPMAAVVFKLVK
jgi:1,4-alpha-glucan branching enzyme